MAVTIKDLGVEAYLNKKVGDGAYTKFKRMQNEQWPKAQIAKELGISRAGLIMKVEKYALDKRKLAR